MIEEHIFNNMAEVLQSQELQPPPENAEIEQYEDNEEEDDEEQYEDDP